MAEKTINHVFPKVLQIGMHDAKVGDDIVHDIQTKLVFVSSQAELDDFTAIEPVGTFAAAYGLGTMWHLNSSREWVEV